MGALGFGKFARADRIFALERITGDERGDGRRTRVWIDGVTEPLIASRTEATILRDMGQEAAILGPELDKALDLAAQLAAAADEGRADLSDLGRRARRLLASTTKPASSSRARPAGKWLAALLRSSDRDHSTEIAVCVTGILSVRSCGSSNAVPDAHSQLGGPRAALARTLGHQTYAGQGRGLSRECGMAGRGGVGPIAPRARLVLACADYMWHCWRC